MLIGFLYSSHIGGAELAELIRRSEWGSEM